MIGHNELILNEGGKTKYHNYLTLQELKEGFSDCGDIISREVKRIKRELKEYDRWGKRIQNSTFRIEQQNFLLAVLEVLCMKQDTRFKHLDRMKALQQLMRNEKYGILTDDIDRARRVPISTLHNFEKVHKTRTGFTALCPLHKDKNPSFSCRNNKWICFSCLKKGSGAIDFLMERDGLNFSDAVKTLLKQ